MTKGQNCANFFRGCYFLGFDAKNMIAGLETPMGMSWTRDEENRSLTVGEKRGKERKKKPWTKGMVRREKDKRGEHKERGQKERVVLEERERISRSKRERMKHVQEEMDGRPGEGIRRGYQERTSQVALRWRIIIVASAVSRILEEPY